MRQKLEPGVFAPRCITSLTAPQPSRVIGESDYVRVGYRALRLEPLDREPSRLEAVMTWRTRIVRLKTSNRRTVGYGTTFPPTAASDCHAAGRYGTVTTAFFRTVFRARSGRRAPVVGRVSMDLVTIDVTDIRDAASGMTWSFSVARGKRRSALKRSLKDRYNLVRSLSARQLTCAEAVPFR